MQSYSATVQQSSENKMVMLDTIDPHIVIDLKYGTPNNFTGVILYKNPHAFLRIRVALALKEINKSLEKSGYRLKIYDAYRPYSVTKKMWSIVKDHRFVANPSKGSGHNRGASVDLTLIDTDTGKELNMGTGYDDFTEKAGHNYTNLPKAVLDNRKLLKNIMQQYGFESLKTEWWHYIYKNHSKYELLDLTFGQLMNYKPNKKI